ncbi:MAG: GNAT family N-acetyltransferase [Nitrospiraceae bacterium]|nr:GNAT family N-acetyltransferase [Nitrospiraceae bacterium]
MHASSRYRDLSALAGLGLTSGSKVLLRNLFSINHYYLLERRILPVGVKNDSRMDLSLARADEGDIEDILAGSKNLGPEDRKEIVSRVLFYRSGFKKNCYIGRDKKGNIALLQWLICPDENSVIDGSYSRKFYRLAPGEVMFENIFVFPRYRGRGLLSASTGMLLEIARKDGYRRALGYIRKDRIPALNEFLKMGFRLVRLIREVKFLGIAARNL